MRPHDDKAARARGRADVRARLRRDLGFIGAVPTGSTFRAVVEPGQPGPGRSWELDARLLSGAVRAAKTLIREAPRALEREVGDPARWLARVERVVAALGPSVHAGAPLPDPRALAGELSGPRAARTLATLPQSPLVDAVCWLHLGAPDALEETLAWLAPRLRRFGPALEGRPEPLDLALRLVRVLHLDGERHADLLLELLSDRVLAGTRLTAPAAKEWLNGRVDRSAGDELARLVTAVLACDDRRRRLGIVVIDRLAPRILAGAWAAWWAATDIVVAHLEPGDARPLLAQLERTPPHLDRTRWACRIEEWLDDADALGALAEALAVVPEEHDGVPVRLGMFFLWSVCRDGAPKPCTTLLRRFARYRRKVSDDARALAPWMSYLRHPWLPSCVLYGRCVDQWLVDEPKAARRIDAFFGALEASARHDRCPWGDAGLVQALADLTKYLGGDDAEAFMAAAIDAGVTRCGSHLPPACLRVALDLAGDRAGVPRETQRACFGELVLRLVEAGIDEEARIGDDPLSLAAVCRDPEVVAVLAAMVRRGEVAPVVELGNRLRALAAADLALPPLTVPSPRRRAFLRHYPPELRPLLAALAGCDPDAEATAAQILGRAIPTPAALEREIAALRDKLARAPDPRVARRLENLERRRGVTPSAADIRKLRGKLALALDRKRVAAWSAAAEGAFAEAVGGALGREPPRWILEAPMIDLWPHLLSLPAPFRRLSIGVVQARLGPYPWDLRDQPANRAFVDQLAARGIDPAPWLDGIGVVRYRSRRGDVYLQLERDPIEVLLMGKRFDTCLSPGAMNFFSAVANAADVNKRVVYGRDAGGAVIGRCLLALTAEGALLAFHPYSHHDEWAFTDHMGDFCRRLATAMKTAIADAGLVPRLVAPDWYDDGPVDLTGRFAPLASGSRLDKALRRVAPGELRALLDKELAPERLDPITLPHVLRLAPLVDRPDLAEAMLAIVAAVPGIDLATRELALERTWRAGAVGAARRFAARHIVPALPRERVRSAITLVVLTEIDEPSLALRVLARTRARGVRRWADEPDGWRIFAGARAHEALHRHKLAASLYTLAMKRGGDTLKHACQARLAAIP